MPTMLDGVRSKVRSGHANASFLFALVGGVLQSLSSVGSFLSGTAQIGPWYMPEIWFTLLFVICVGDWSKDSIPNRPAVYTAILFPSCWVAMFTGASGEQLFKAVKALDAKTGADLQKWIVDHLSVRGDLRSAFTALSIIFVVAAVVYAQRYAKANKGAVPAGARG